MDLVHGVYVRKSAQHLLSQDSYNNFRNRALLNHRNQFPSLLVLFNDMKPSAVKKDVNNFGDVIVGLR